MGEKMEEKTRTKLLLHIIDKLSSKGNRSGETNIQKLIYFTITGNLEKPQYEYTLHNFGPYSFSLKDDLTFMENSRMVFKEPDPSGFGFRYIPNKNMDFVNKLLTESRFEYQKLDELIDKFRTIPAKHLGLLATFIYAYRKYKIKDDKELIETVMEIKPMFSKWELEGTLERYNNMIKSDTIDLASYHY